MTARRRRSLLRKPAVLLVAFVSIIALTGVVYAHWYTDTTVNGNVQTGNLGVQWWAGGTNDDGILDNDWSGNDCDDPFDGSVPGDCPEEIWDGNGDGSSADPSAPWPNEGARYDKDVASCDAQGNGDHLQVNVNNAYPSYHCTAYGQLYGDQQVPVSAAGAYVYDWEFFEYTFAGWEYEDGTPYDGDVVGDGEGNWCEDIPEAAEDDPGTPDYDESQPNGQCDEWEAFVFGTQNETMLVVTEPVDGKFEARNPNNDPGMRHVLSVWVGDACGGQIDPFFDWDQGDPFDSPEPNWGAVSVHVEQWAQQGSNYGFSVHPRFVNWNEFEEGLCTFDLLSS